MVDLATFLSIFPRQNKGLTIVTENFTTFITARKEICRLKVTLGASSLRDDSLGKGTKRIVRFWGGGERTIERPLQNHFWRPQKVGFVWSVPVSSKENDME